MIEILNEKLTQTKVSEFELNKSHKNYFKQQ